MATRERNTVKEQLDRSRSAIIPRLLHLSATLWRTAPDHSWQSWMDMDLTMSQFKLLLLVAANDRSRVGDLAHALGVTPPTVTTSLDRLVAHGLVRREDDPIDRRLVIARLTHDGKELLERLNLYNQKEIADCLTALDEEDLRCLCVGMEALHRAWLAKQAGRANRHVNGLEPDPC
ncbi:MAG TPA: MarR family transcriptional regulator [Chloroflexota bacterium]|nr:MarR family transcriptional regulator [Chloroflexota bacterium]